MLSKIVRRHNRGREKGNRFLPQHIAQFISGCRGESVVDLNDPDFPVPHFVSQKMGIFVFPYQAGTVRRDSQRRLRQQRDGLSEDLPGRITEQLFGSAIEER
ncbi:MAG TPA: hypothetical protein VGC14_17410 [Rhizobium sp.]